MFFSKIDNINQMQLLSDMAKDIWRECYSDILLSAQIEYMTEKYLSCGAIAESIDKDGYVYCFINDDNNNTAGFTAYKAEENSLFLSKLYIKKEYRGKGAGSFAINSLVNMCTDKGLSYIWLTVNVHNDNAIATYKKNGFYITEDKCTDIGNGFFMDDHFMRKEINSNT